MMGSLLCLPPLPPPHSYSHLSKLTGKTAIRVIFILFSLVGIYLTAENRDRTKIAALGGDCDDGTFCSLCVLYKGLLRQSSVPLAGLIQRDLRAVWSRTKRRSSAPRPAGGALAREEQVFLCQSSSHHVFCRPVLS